ncbi:hypothetical protein BKA59DRAFT_473020 [Fusarium tricinctum]|uniref:Uncharacterized protein n=1 Tax=Fusarium tricinctum TaxID=61284 RepID=A0A8K0S559_9HYPO|nr:hypothetical protein BKA59DRAFT_473020 [Fusarium tricinctum]
MCLKIVRVSTCWQCTATLDPFGKMRYCGDSVTNGKFCEAKMAQIIGPGDLLCRLCLIANKGVNKLNLKQRMPEGWM